MLPTYKADSVRVATRMFTLKRSSIISTAGFTPPNVDFKLDLRNDSSKNKKSKGVLYSRENSLRRGNVDCIVQAFTNNPTSYLKDYAKAYVYARGKPSADNCRVYERIYILVVSEHRITTYKSQNQREVKQLQLRNIREDRLTFNECII